MYEGDVWSVISNIYVDCFGKEIDQVLLELVTGGIVKKDPAYYNEVHSWIENLSLDDTEYVHYLYYVLLGREETASENSAWCENLKQYTREDVLSSFFESDEFVSRHYN